jgi:hypothetical protein
VALYWLKFGTDTVVFHLVVAGDHADLALIFQSDLRRTNDMSGRKEANLYAIDRRFFIVGQGFYMKVCTKTVLQYRLGELVAEVRIIAPFYMVCMAVGRYSEVYRLPGVNVKVSLFAVNTLVCERYQSHVYTTNFLNLSLLAGCS